MMLMMMMMMMLTVMMCVLFCFVFVVKLFMGEAQLPHWPTQRA